MAVIRNLCTPCDDAAFYNQITIAGDAPVISESAAPSGGDHPTLAPQVVVQEYDDIHRLFVSNDAATWSHIDVSYNAAQSIANIAALPDANTGTHESYYVRSNRMVYNRTRSSYYTADFDGSASSIDLEKILVHPTADFDISFEFNLRAIPVGDSDFLFSQYDFGVDGRFNILAQTDATVGAFIDGLTDVLMYTSTTILPGAWYTYRLTRTGDTFRLYLNGQLENSQTQTGISVQQKNSHLGTDFTPSDDINCLMRNVSITSNGTTTKYLTETIDLPGATPAGGAASSLEAVEKFVPTKISYCDTDTEWSNMTEMVDGQVLYHRGRSAAYVYSETSGSWSLYGTPLSSSKKVPEVSVERTALYLDNRAGENYVANYDNKAWLVDQSRNGTPRRMRPKYTLNLNGSTEYATGPNLDTELSTELTVSLWFNTDTISSPGDYAMLVGTWDGSANKGWVVDLNGGAGNGVVGFYVSRDGTNTNFSNCLSEAISINTWVHACARFNNGVLSLFLNGVDQGAQSTTGTGATTSLYATGYDILIGAEANGGATYHFDGTMDDLRIYNTALTDAQIADLAALKPGSTRGANVGETPLVWYDFEGPTDSNLLLNKGSLGPNADAVINVNNARDAVGYYSFANEVGFSETTPRLDFNGPTAWHGSYASTYQFDGPFRVDLIWRNVSHGEDHIGFTDLDVNSSFQTSVYNHARQAGIRITPSTCFAYINAGGAAASTGVASGDIISIERDDNDVIHFRKNGVDFYTSSPQTGTFRYVYANYGNRKSYQTSVSENGIRLTNDQLDMFPFGNQKELLNGAVENSTAVIPADPTRPFTHDAEGLGGLQYVGQCPHGAKISSPVATLNALNEYLDVPISLSSASSWSIAFKMKTSDTGATAWCSRDDNDDGYRFYFDGNAYISSDATDVTAVTTFNDGEWHDFVTEWDGATATLSVDGTVVLSGALAAAASLSATTIRFGDRLYSTGSPLNGQISDITITVDGTIEARLPLCEGSANVAHDTSGNGNHGEIIGSVWDGDTIDTVDTLVSDGYFIGTWFDGANDSYTASGRLTTGQVTALSACCWLTVDQAQNQTICSEYLFTGNNRSWNWRVNTSEQMELVASSDGAGGSISATSPTFFSNYSSELVHVGFSFDGSVPELKWYVNGVLVETDDPTFTYFADVPCDFTIGNTLTTQFFEGVISQLVVEQTVWTDEEFASLMKSGKTEEVKSIRSNAYYFPYGNGNETLQGIAQLIENGAPEQRVIPYGTSTSNGIVIPRTHGPGVLAPGQSIDLYNDETDSPYATRLDTTLTNGTYAQGDDKEDSILYVRTDETGDDRISVFDEALSGNDDSAIREDTR